MVSPLFFTIFYKCMQKSGNTFHGGVEASILEMILPGAIFEKRLSRCIGHERFFGGHSCWPSDRLWSGLKQSSRYERRNG